MFSHFLLRAPYKCRALNNYHKPEGLGMWSARAACNEFDLFGAVLSARSKRLNWIM